MANDNEIVNIGVNAVLNIDTTLLKNTIEGLSKSLSTSFSTSALKSVEGFSKKLKENLQIAFDDTVISKLKQPIKITLDTKDAESKIDSLSKKMSNIAKPLDNLAKVERVKKQKISDDEKKQKIISQASILRESADIIDKQILSAKRTTNNAGLRAAKERAIADAEKIRKEIELIPSKDGLLSDSQVVTIQKKTEKIKKIFSDYIESERKFQEDRKKLLKEATTLSGKNSLNKLLGDIENAKVRLESKGFTEKQIISASRSVSTQVANLFKDADLLANALKSKTPDLKLIENLVERINKGTFSAKSKVSVIGTSKDISVAPTTALNTKIANSTAAADAAQLAKLTAAFNPSKIRASENQLEALHDELETVIKTISKSGIPITVVTKQTSSYDRSIVNLKKDLANIDQEYRSNNITLEQAAKAYEKVNADIRKLGVGIRQIDANRIKNAFGLEESDPKSIGIRFAGLGFTLGAVSNALLNFSRNTVQVFTNLAQVAEPIERVNNSLDLLVKNGQLSLEQKISTLETLRDIGDLPGSTVETANQTFEQLKRINLTLSERLELTKGLAKLPATTGGVAKDTNQLANALTKAASGGKFEGQQFSTILEQGGETVKKLNDRLGLGSAEDITQFGVLNYIRELSKELSTLESPALTTTDRINKLKSRFSEFGVIFGTIVAPALDRLNLFLRNTLQPILKSIGESFQKLPEGTKNFISTIVLGIPVAVGVFGSLLAVLVAINFSISSIVQGLKLIPILSPIIKSKLSGIIGTGSAAAVPAARAGVTAVAAAPFAGIAGILGAGAAGAAPVAAAIPAGAPFAGIAAGRAAAGAVAGAAGGAATVSLLSRISTLLGTILKGLPKILGLTNPIGIAINLLLSGIIAFFQNFLGVKDRLLTALSQLDAPINKLLKAFGLEEGGLAYVLGIIGKSLLFVLNSLGSLLSLIGGVVVEALTSVITTLRDIIDNIADLFTSLKSANIIDTFKSIFKLLGNLLFGTFYNISINIAALISDAIAAAIESTLGSGFISKNIRNSVNELRKKNGTDLESTLNRKADKERQEANNKLFEEKKKQQQELADLIKQEEQDRVERIKQSTNELGLLLKKSKEEYKKFQDEQKQEGLKERRAGIEQSLNNLTSFYKKPLDLAVTTQSADYVANYINKQLEKFKSAEIGIELESSSLESLTQIRELISRSGELAPLFTLFDAGDPKTRQFVEILNKLNTTTDFNQIAQLTKDLVTAAEAIEDKEVRFRRGGDTGRQDTRLSGLATKARNIQEKASLAISKGQTKINEVNLKYKQKEQELNDATLDAKEKIAQDDRERANAIEDRLRKQREIQADIDRLIKIEIESRNEVVKTITADTNARDEAKIQRDRETQTYLETLDREKEKIKANSDFQRQRINTLDKTAKELSLKLLDEQSTKKLNNLNNEINQIKKGADELNKKYQELADETDKTFVIEVYKNIFKGLRDITNESLEALNKFSDVFARFSTKFKASGGKSNTELAGILNEELNRLVKKEGLSQISSGYIELKDIIKQIEIGTYNSTVAIEKFINVISKIKSQPELDTFAKQVDTVNLLIRKLFNGDTYTFNKEIDNDPNKPFLSTGAPVTKGGLEALLQALIKRSGSANIGNNIISVLQNKELSDIDFESLLKKATGERSVSIKGVEKSIIEILSLTAAESEKSLLYILSKVFGFNKESSTLIIEAIKTYQAKVILDNSLIKNTLESRITQADAFLRDKLKINQNETDALEEKLRISQRRSSSATGSELEKLKAEQRDIKIKLVNFNYEKLDLEEAYNIQKSIIQANGNEAEISEIVRAGKERRDKLKEQRDLDLKELVLSIGGRVGKNGELLDSKGNPIARTSSVTVADIGDNTGTITNKTKPSGKDSPILSGPEKISAGIAILRDQLDGVGNSARKAANDVLDFYNRIASGEGVINIFKDLIGGMGVSLKSLGKVFTEVAKFAITAFADAIGKAITDSLVNGGSFIKNLGKFFGEILIQLGSLLLQLGVTALVIAGLSKIPFFRKIFGPPELTLAGAALATAAGAGLIAAGVALGGGNTTQAAVSNTGAANSANSAAGNSGQTEYDPEKDPKLIYQKAQRTEIYIDIKRDDGSIVKSVIRQVNRNPAFANLIGNNRTGINL